MGSYNGFVSSLIKGSSTGGEDAVLDGVSASSIVETIPAKFMNRAIYAATITGISGTISVNVIGSIGAATYVIAGVSGIATNGTHLIGSSTESGGSPRPSSIEWASGEDGSGFTGSVFMAGEYG